MTDKQTSGETPGTNTPLCKHHFFSGVGSAILLCVLIIIGVPLILGATGVVSTSALASWGPIDGFMDWANENSYTYHATTMTNPYLNDPQAIRIGLDHYKKNCMVCHAAPGIDPTELAQGLNPAPPKLDSHGTQNMTDGELFWVISQGVRMTGMPAFKPTHTDKEIWQIVAFLRRLPHLTAAEKAGLQAGVEVEETHHHHSNMR